MIAARFLRHVSKQANGCWLWTAALDRHGYGQFWWNGSHWRAHRAAYVMWRGPIPAGLLVLHSCDVRACVNPDHLAVGSTQDNVDDRNAKGRQARGGRNGAAKLSSEEVARVRRRYASGNVTQQELADELGVTQGAISRAVRALSWRDVAGSEVCR